MDILRKIETGIILVLAVGFILAIGLRGMVAPQTIQILEGQRYIGSVYAESQNVTQLGYEENFAGWFVGFKDPTVNASVKANPTMLSIDGIFQRTTVSTSIAIFKALNVDIIKFPILEVDLDVSKGIGYGIRFYSKYANDTTYDLWWESSPLDHRSGIGPELIRINIQRQAELATGHLVQKVAYIGFYMEKIASTTANFHALLSKIRLETYSLSALLPGKQYRAIYLDLDNIIQDQRLNFEKMHVGTTMVATPGTILSIYFMYRNALYSTGRGSTVPYSAMAPYYKFTFYPNSLEHIFSELLPKSNASFIIVADSGFIQNVQFDSLDLIYGPVNDVVGNISRDSLTFYFGYMLFFLFIAPIASAILVFYRGFRGLRISGLKIIAVLTVGIACRFALALVTQHEFDVDVQATSARAWFQTGSDSGSIGPTLPLTYFLYWMGYSYYAVLQLAGFHDYHLFAHNVGMVEAVFVKLFPMLADTLIFTLLLRTRSNARSFVWASFYLLNPLSIYISSVWGMYDAATVMLIIVGTYFVMQEKTVQAGLAFTVSGMVQLLGFIPYAILLVSTSMSRRGKLILALVATLALVFLYPLERLLIVREFLAVAGVTTALSYSKPGIYSLIGSFPSLNFLSNAHPLLIASGCILAGVISDAYNHRLEGSSILLYTGLASLAFLVFSDLLAAWIWLLPLALFYCIAKEKDGLGSFTLVFGGSLAFLMMNYTVGGGPGYLITGEVGHTILPKVELLSNGLQLFTVMVTILSILLLGLFATGRRDPTKTLVGSSILAIITYAILYAWLG